MIRKPSPRVIAVPLLLTGGAVIGVASLADDLAPVMAGVAVFTSGLAALVTHAVGRMVSDTSRERQQLQQAQAEVEADRLKYVALRAVHDHEQERLCQRMEQMEADLAERLRGERQEILADLEAREADLRRQGFMIGLDYKDRGVLGGNGLADLNAKVIRLPVKSVESPESQGASSPL